MGFFASLYFDFSDQKIRRNRRYRHPTRFRSTTPIEHTLGVGCCENLLKGGERCADQVYTTNEFVGSSILPDPVHGHRLNSECIGRHPTGKGEPSRNVFKNEAMIAVVVPNFFQQFLSKTFARKCSFGRHQ